jgi:hypothetical protein
VSVAFGRHLTALATSSRPIAELSPSNLRPEVCWVGWWRSADEMRHMTLVR